MSFERALELTRSHYGKYPGPTRETYDLALQVAAYLKTNKVSTPGVIAVAIGSDQHKALPSGTYYFLGLSPDLQRAVMTNMQMDEEAVDRGKAYGHFRLGRGLETMTGKRFDLSRKVSDAIAQKVTHNRGCAEKKILSNILTRKEKLLEISVVSFPDTQYATDIPAHIVAVSSEAAYIAPCDSCLAVYHG